MTSIPLVYSPFYSYSFPANHRFPMSKFHHLYQCLDAQGVIKNNNVFRPGRVKAEVLALAHDDDYINRFENNLLSTKELRKMGLPWSEPLVKRSMISPNGTLMTGSIALNHGIACHLAGGTHHANYDHGRGYCIFNDLAVAAKSLIAQNKAKRILIFDCDVHQGDGTASILSDDEHIFTCSIHCEKNFPHHKATSDLDVGLPKGMNDAEYLIVVEETLYQAIQLSQPDLVFYDAGVDIYANDGLGYLNISTDGILARERLVLSTLKQHNLPVATVIGGGYDKDTPALAKRHALVFQAAQEIYS
ncbi:histone deacetylase [Marinicella sp. S1101]|uniref:histone deacetylase family protein n=1 Tax=Marinicella marina TaxID=2996016 RepID=UPI0022608CA5|nr:histone deacetylase [Marinicella marina]MCX7554502.1 histone deacetylase [Marinicella marina]MDJ1140653.1 histone deacetylase [Marinicella marina]